MPWVPKDSDWLPRHVHQQIRHVRYLQVLVGLYLVTIKDGKACYIGGSKKFHIRSASSES